MVPTGAFITSIAAFFTIKVATSIDDLLWLSPFLAISSSDDSRVGEKIQCCIIYVCVSILVTLEALGAAFFAKHGLKTMLHEQLVEKEQNQGDSSSSYWKASRVLSILGATFIAGFAWKEYKDADNNNTSADHSLDPTVAPIGDEISPLLLRQNEETALISTGAHLQSAVEEGNYGSLPSIQNNNGRFFEEQRNDADNQLEIPKPGEENVSSSFFVVALFGTLDTLAVLASILTGLSDVEWLSVILGTLLATVVIMLAAWCITLFTPFVNFVQRIPLWTLMALIACYVLLSGLLDD